VRSFTSSRLGTVGIGECFSKIKATSLKNVDIAPSRGKDGVGVKMEISLGISFGKHGGKKELGGSTKN